MARPPALAPASSAPAIAAPAWRDQVRSLALAALPAGLLTAATAMVAREAGASPLLRSMPAIIYVASILLALSPRPLAAAAWLRAVQTPLLVSAAFVVTWNEIGQLGGSLFLLFGVQFITSLVCHGELALRRPATWSRPNYSNHVAAGVVLGAAAAALSPALPIATEHVYLALVVVAALLRPMTDRAEEPASGSYRLAASTVLRDVSVPAVGLALLFMLSPKLEGGGATALPLFGLVVIFTTVFTLLSAGRPLRFGLCVIALALFGAQLRSFTPQATAFGTNGRINATTTGSGPLAFPPRAASPADFSPRLR